MALSMSKLGALVTGSQRRTDTKMAPYLAFEDSRSKRIETADGTTLFLRYWLPPAGRETKGTALLVHGLGEHSGRYGHVAHGLNQLGLEVWAHDHRGFGQSGGDRAKIADSNTLIEDTKAVFDLLHEHAGAKPPILLGHSMGGAIAARAVTGGWITPRALVLSSPGLKSYLNPPMRFAVRCLERILPNLVIPHGLPLDKISHDLEVITQSQGDPLNHALISPRITMFIVTAGEAAIRDAGKLTVPVLVQAAGDDKLVDPDGSREFAAAVPAGLCTLKIYDGLWHEIYNEREPDRSVVLGDLADWVSNVVLD
jgi:alpha-beta hydrolase superfamily lysophospholipase